MPKKRKRLVPRVAKRLMGAPWSDSERAEIAALAELKGVSPAAIVKDAVRKLLQGEKQ